MSWRQTCWTCLVRSLQSDVFKSQIQSPTFESRPRVCITHVFISFQLCFNFSEYMAQVIVFQIAVTAAAISTFLLCAAAGNYYVFVWRWFFITAMSIDLLANGHHHNMFHRILRAQFLAPKMVGTDPFFVPTFTSIQLLIVFHYKCIFHEFIFYFLLKTKTVT